MKKEEIMAGLFRKVAAGEPIIGCGAGTGRSAAAEQKGGADFMIVYSTGSYRMAGRSSLFGRFACGDANAAAYGMTKDLHSLLGDAPILTGVFAQDPFRDIGLYLQDLKRAGCVGIQNIPGTGGLAVMEGDDTAAAFDSAGLGFDCEVAMMKLANEFGLITSPYCSKPEHIVKMAAIGADLFVLHMGLTGSREDKEIITSPMEECIAQVDMLSALALKKKKDAIILVHGGPIAEPDDFRYIYRRCKSIHGFYGASSIERVPVGRAVTQMTRAFKSLSICRGGI